MTCKYTITLSDELLHQLKDLKPRQKTALLHKNNIHFCPSCEKYRPLEIKIKNHSRCSICDAYKSHKRDLKDRADSFDVFEVDRINRLMFINGDLKKCISCLEFKTHHEFGFETGAFCNSCWHDDEQTKVRELRKLLREPIRRNARHKTFQQTFGYSVDELIIHLSHLFTDGMTVDGIYNGDIHIDHIIPASAFDHNNPNHVAYCWSLRNLQPLWATNNQAKQDYLSNGMRVQNIRRKPNARQELDKLLLDLYGLAL